MRTAVDTNILSALWSNESTAHEISISLGKARAQGGLVICAPVFAESLAHPSMTLDFLETFLQETGISVDFSMEERVWRQAASSFAIYAERRRRSAGTAPKRLLVDFVIGAHALLHADRLMTLEAQRYARDFPKLHII